MPKLMVMVTPYCAKSKFVSVVRQSLRLDARSCVFAWEWTWCGGTLPAAAELHPEEMRPLNPPLCCPASLYQAAALCTSMLGSFAWPHSFGLLAGTEGRNGSMRSVKTMKPLGRKEQQRLSREMCGLYLIWIPRMRQSGLFLCSQRVGC